jgi:hypothetical protein
MLRARRRLAAAQDSHALSHFQLGVATGPEQPFKIKINRSALFVKAAIQSCCGEIDAAISMMNKLTMT